MSYAIRNDNQAFRTVDGPDQVGPDEYWSTTPIEIVPLPPTNEELAAREREWRDIELSSVIWLRDRHRDQLDLGTAPALTPELFIDLLAYMQALRDWPQSSDFPDSQHRPTVPAWISEQTQ